MGALHAGQSQRTKATRRALEHVATGNRLADMRHGFQVLVQVAKVEAGKKSMKDTSPSILLVCVSIMFLQIGQGK